MNGTENILYDGKNIGVKQINVAHCMGGKMTILFIKCQKLTFYQLKAPLSMIEASNR